MREAKKPTGRNGNGHGKTIAPAPRTNALMTETDELAAAIKDLSERIAAGTVPFDTLVHVLQSLREIEGESQVGLSTKIDVALNSLYQAMGDTYEKAVDSQLENLGIQISERLQDGGLTVAIIRGIGR